jgi:hypothetical protein
MFQRIMVILTIATLSACQAPTPPTPPTATAAPAPIVPDIKGIRLGQTPAEFKAHFPEATCKSLEEPDTTQCTTNGQTLGGHSTIVEATYDHDRAFLVNAYGIDKAAMPDITAALVVKYGVPADVAHRPAKLQDPRETVWAGNGWWLVSSTVAYQSMGVVMLTDSRWLDRKERSRIKAAAQDL